MARVVTVNVHHATTTLRKLEGKRKREQALAQAARREKLRHTCACKDASFCIKEVRAVFATLAEYLREQVILTRFGKADRGGGGWECGPQCTTSRRVRARPSGGT